MINRECLWTAKWKWFVFVRTWKERKKSSAMRIKRLSVASVVDGDNDFYFHYANLRLSIVSLMKCLNRLISFQFTWQLFRSCRMSKEVGGMMSESALRRAFIKRKFKFYDKWEMTEKFLRILRNLLYSWNLLKFNLNKKIWFFCNFPMTFLEKETANS